MNIAIKDILFVIGSFFVNKRNRRILYLSAIIIAAMLDFFLGNISRKTFVFFSGIEDNLVVEERMLHITDDPETDIGRYIDEVLLGPVSPGLEPLFPRDTRLHSYMLRDGTVYANLTENALFQPSPSHDIFRSLLTLNEGIRRNFSNVEDVKLFIGGNEVFFEQFYGIFGNSADN